MRVAVSADAVRAAERPLIEAAARDADPDRLMRRAAHGLARVVVGELRSRTGGVAGRTVVLVVGAGDNGGDALYAGALLARRGVRVCALRTADRVHERGLAAFVESGGRVTGEPPAAVDVVVDGVTGLSGRGPLRAPAARAFETVRGVPVVAVDLPSGVDADTGQVHDPAVRAEVTVTFGALRRAHLLAAPQCGRIELVDLGIELGIEPGIGVGAGAGAETGAGDEVLRAPELADVGRWWPVPGPRDDKYSQGVVGVRAGSSRFPGAAVLCASAAVPATSGMVRYAGPCGPQVLAARPEVVCAETPSGTGRVQAWVAGPGMGTDARAVAELDEILGARVPVVLDADALTVVAEHPSMLRSRAASVLLTPHDGEFERLAGHPPGADRAGAVRALVHAFANRGISATVLLKGRVTIVDDGHAAWAVDAGSSWAATAGSGDVLSGILGALLAAGAAGTADSALPDVAALAAGTALVHGRAAALAATRFGGPGVPVGASDLLAAVPAAIGEARGRAAR